MAHRAAADGAGAGEVMVDLAPHRGRFTQHGLVEVGVGLSADEQDVTNWVALAARCVSCGRIQGLTDLVVDGIPRQEVIDRV